MAVLVEGYWCAVAARAPDLSGEWFLGGYQATAPHLAVRWLREQARRLADALDPEPGEGVFPAACLRRAGEGQPNPGRVFRTWMADFRYQGTQLQALAAGNQISISSGDLDVCYCLSARPVSVESRLTLSGAVGTR
jgi:hypothetical protein